MKALATLLLTWAKQRKKESSPSNQGEAGYSPSTLTALRRVLKSLAILMLL